MEGRGERERREREARESCTHLHGGVADEGFEHGEQRVLVAAQQAHAHLVTVLVTVVGGIKGRRGDTGGGVRYGLNRGWAVGNLRPDWATQ